MWANNTGSWSERDEEDALIAAALELFAVDDDGVVSGAEDARTQQQTDDWQSPLTSLYEQTTTMRCPQPPPKQRTSSAARRKREIAQLRDEATELQKKLRVLEEKRVKREGETCGDEDDATRQDRWVAEVMAKEWSAIAKRQLDQRQRSEQEQRELQAALEEQRRISRSLQTLILKLQDKAKRWDFVHCMAPIPVTNEQVMAGDALVVLDALTAALDPMYWQTDALFSDPRLNVLTGNFYDVHTQLTPGVGGLSVQSIDSRIVPFSVEDTAAAVWKHIRNRTTTISSGYCEELPDKTLRTHYVGRIKLGSFHSVAKATTALRRIVEPDRIVMIRCSIFSYVEPLEPSPPELELITGGKPLRHFLWMAVERPRHSDLRQQPFGSQVHSCSISIPTISALSGDADCLEKMTKFFTMMSRQFALRAREDVDNYLLTTKSRPHQERSR